MLFCLKHAVFVIILLMVTPAFAEQQYPQFSKTGAKIENWVPDGWEIINKISGDLNKDGKTDVAMIIQSQKKMPEDRSCPGDEWSTNDQPRILIILFANPKGGWQLAARDNKIIKRASEGGIMGDPLREMAIENGSLLIKFSGGSSLRWFEQARFRYKNGAFYLIGFTSEGQDIRNGTHKDSDHNLLTGKQRNRIWQEGNCTLCKKGKECPESNYCSKGEKQIFDTVKWQRLKPSQIKLTDYFCAKLPE